MSYETQEFPSERHRAKLHTVSNTECCPWVQDMGGRSGRLTIEIVRALRSCRVWVFVPSKPGAGSHPLPPPAQAVALCDRNFGIGGDGVIFALPAVGDTDYTMRIFNSDGSEPEMCGNGIRCLARFVSDLDGGSASLHKVTQRPGSFGPDASGAHPCCPLGM